MKLLYETRGADGKDFVKEVSIKEFPIENAEFDCKVCGKHFSKGIKTKKAVSGSFTDFAFLGEYICEECSRMFTLNYYNYIVGPDGIRLLNVRQLKYELCNHQKTPFRFIITTTQKKHLFYRSVENYDSEKYAVNLETEVIYTTCERMKELFSFVESLLVLGAAKKGMTGGEIPFNVIEKTGIEPLEFLRNELEISREIQIPLYCGQKLEIKEEDAICSISSILKARKEGKRR